MLVALLEICDIYRYIMIPIMRHIRNEEIGVQKQIHRVKERLFESSKARDVTEHLNNGNLVTNFRVLCVLGISSFSSPKIKLLQVSTKNCNLRPGPIPEVCDSQASCHSAHAQGKVWQVWLAENSKWLLCAYSRGHNSSCWPKGVPPLGMRMAISWEIMVHGEYMHTSYVSYPNGHLAYFVDLV